ncbi:hypothetical protein EG329_012328, partial [Mollisiaceae sp. DMI_Dod_QoI]
MPRTSPLFPVAVTAEDIASFPTKQATILEVQEWLSQTFFSPKDKDRSDRPSHYAQDQQRIQQCKLTGVALHEAAILSILSTISKITSHRRFGRSKARDI